MRRSSMRGAIRWIAASPASSSSSPKGLVSYRRESQMLWYTIADPRVETLLALLYQLYCKD